MAPLSLWFHPPAPPAPRDGQTFAHWLGPVAQEVNRRTGIPASVTIAQGYHESASGQHGGYSELLTKHHNPYGLKVGACTKALAVGSVTLDTWEHEPGNVVPGAFAVFPHVYAATLARARLFYCSPYYRDALASRGNARAFLEAIAPAYATDPQYAELVWSLVEELDLQAWDVSPRGWDLDAGIVPAAHIASWQDAVGVPA